jgi:hypothetical protein
LPYGDEDEDFAGILINTYAMLAKPISDSHPPQAG